MFCPAYPDLLAINDVFVALTPGCRAKGGGVSARGRLCYAKGLQTQFARCNLGQVFSLLRVRAVAQNRAHRVHLRMARSGVAACAMHFLKDRGASRYWQAKAAEPFGDKRAEITIFCQRPHKLGRIGLLTVFGAPIFAGEPFAQFGDCIADLGMVEFIGHSVRPCWFRNGFSPAPDRGKALRGVRSAGDRFTARLG